MQNNSTQQEGHFTVHEKRHDTKHKHFTHSIQMMF